MKFFDLDSPLIRFLTRVADLFILNILFLLCCLPIVTIGASAIALYTVTLKAVRNEESYIAKSFFQAFRRNLKIGVITWVIVLFLGVILFLDFQFILFIPVSLGNILRILTLFILFLYLIVVLYLFPYIARFENTVIDSIKNSFLIAVTHLLYTVLLIVIAIVAGVATLFMNFGFISFVWFVIGFSGMAYINSYFFRKIFEKYE